MTDIEAIEARLNAISQEPWEQEAEKLGKRSKSVLVIWSKAHVVCRVGAVGMPNVKEDTDFIQNAPTDIRFLLAALAAEREQKEKVERKYEEFVLSQHILRQQYNAERARAEEAVGRMAALSERMNMPIQELIEIADLEQERDAAREQSVRYGSEALKHQADYLLTNEVLEATEAELRVVSGEAACLARRLQEEQERAGKAQEELQQLQRTITQMRDGGHELPASLVEETFRWEEPSR